MSGILGLLADAEKLSPEQRSQSVKDGVLPPDLATMIDSAGKDINQSQQPSSDGTSLSDQIMGKADQVLDPKNEILNKIDVLKDEMRRIQDAIQEGEIKPYVGIPLIEKKMGELDQLQALIQPPQQQPQITQMPQGMPQQPQQPQASQMPQSLNGQQPPSQGLNALQSNLPQQMAHGGIVNLASGDYIDADDEDDEDEQRAFESQMANMPMGEGLGSAIMARADTKKPSMSSFTEGIKSLGKKPAENIEKEPSRPTPKTAKEFYQNMYGDIKKVAEKMGVSNPDAIAHLGASQSAIETGYGKHAPNNNFFGIKGAGSKQTTQEYIPGKGMVTIQDSFRGYKDPQESIKDYIDFLQTNPRFKSVLEAKNVQDAIKAQSLTGYATDPKYGSKLNSIYASNMAEGGIVRLAHGGYIPRFNAGTSVFDPFGQPARTFPTVDDPFGYPPEKTTEAPYKRFLTNASQVGKGLKDSFNAIRGVGLGGSSLASTAAPIVIGGGLLSTGATNALNNASNEQLQQLATDIGSDTGIAASIILESRGANEAGRPKEEIPKPIPLPKKDKKNIDTTYPDQNSRREEQIKIPDYTNDVPPPPSSQPLPIEEPKEEKQKSNMDNFLDYLSQSRDELKKSHETDKYMGLLMAGLGMMGGTSQFAGANIGKGASQGVQHFADLQKQQAAEKANLDKLDLYGRRAQETSDLYRSMRQTPEERAYALQEQLDVKRNAQRGLDEERLNKRLSGRQTQIENNVRNLLKMDTIGNITDPDMMNKYNSAVSRALANDAPYNSLYKQVYGTDYNIPNMAEIAGLPKIKEINGKTYVLQDNNKYKEK